MNDIHGRKEAIEPCYRKVRHVSAIESYKLLPQTNCEACGYSTCLGFAAALSRQKTIPDRCPGFRRPIAESAVYPVYDKEGALVSTVTLDLDPVEEGDTRGKRAGRNRPAPNKLPAISPGETAKAEKEAEFAIQPLTGREKAVLSLLVQGATNAEISEILRISPHTVKSHVIHIFNKLNVNDRTQASVLAVRLNLLAD